MSYEISLPVEVIARKIEGLEVDQIQSLIVSEKEHVLNDLVS